MNNKITNEKTSIKPSEECFNDKDRLNDLLIGDKHLAYMYSLACQEASNPDLYDEFFNLFEQASQIQRDTYLCMFEKGWYQLEKETTEKIEQTHQSFKSKEAHLETE